MMAEQNHTITSKGLFLPTWIVVLVLTPIFTIGGSVLGWVAYTLIDQKQSLVKIESKLDGNNALMERAVQSAVDRINRLEDHVFSGKYKQE